MSETEWRTRVDLAACYRLIELFGWSDLVNTRITARIPGASEHFLINRVDLLYDEITASSLVKIDSDGNNVEPTDAPGQSRRICDPERDPSRPSRDRLRHPHAHDRRLRGIDAEAGAIAAEPARAAGTRRCGLP
jgi:ribulose-5-phosphate 4-epimerase/fuculose-1-phosphate aldolase